MNVLIVLFVVLLVSVLSGIFAFIYVNILTQPGQILAFWARWLYSIRSTFIEAVENQPERVYQRSIFADKWLKPLLTCVYCVSGQVGFWLSIYIQYRYFNLDFVIVLLSASCAIYVAHVLQKITPTYLD